MHLRPANEDRDLALIQSLYHEAYPPPVPHASHLVNNHHVRIAETDDGIVIGFRVLSASNFVWVGVLAEYRRRGVGTLLLHDALEQASELGFTELTSRVLASTTSGNAFCERFKFKPFVHAVNLALDLADWDESALTPMLHKAGEGGIQFLTFADMGDNSANRHRLYTLNKTLSATIPRDQPQEFIGFETYVERRIASKTMPHDGIFIALDNHEWIGMSQMSLEQDFAFSQMTGVLPPYRGKGIAQALKHLSIRFAQRHNYTLIWTFNDVSNQPMIAVNKNAGFRQGEEFYLVRRKPLMDAL